MAIKITIGDPFLIGLSVKEETANTNTDLSTGWTCSAAIHERTVAGNTLPGLSTSVANGSLVLNINKTSTALYKEGPAVLLIKIAKNDDTVILRDKKDLMIVKENI